MTTKDDFLFQKGEYLWDEKCRNRSNNQYSNLNLNQIPSSTPVQFCSKSNKDKTWNDKQKFKCLKIATINFKRQQQNFELKDSAISENSEEKKKLQTWNKNFSTLKMKSEKEKDQKSWKKDATLISITTNISTLKYYENSFASEKEKIEKFGSTKKRGNEKQSFIDIFSTFIIQNPFEFSRQQNDKIPEPEMAQYKALKTLLNPNENKPQPIEQKPTEQKPNESLLSRTTAFFSKINIFKTKPSNIPNPTTQKEEEEDLKTAIELDDRLTAFNIVQISALILVSLFHSFGILIIAFFFSIYQLFLSIFHIIKYCWENPGHFKYGYQALKYAYEKEWWTLKGIYRWITEPPPPPVFAQRTLSGEIKMDLEDVAKLEEIRMKKMFHQKCLNGKFLPAEFVPPQNIKQI